jgi:hypothetical protein
VNKTLLITGILAVAVWMYLRSKSGATGGAVQPQGNVATGGTSTGEPWAAAAGTVGAAAVTGIIGGLFGSGSGSSDSDQSINSD